MGMIGRLPNGEEVMLPHPDIPCAWCGRHNMDWNACPNAHDICNYCCGEEEEYDVDPWKMVLTAANMRVGLSQDLREASRVFLSARLDYLAVLLWLASLRLLQDVEQMALWLAEHEND